MEKDMNKSNAENPLVSIIVPVYRVEKYLQKCLDSIATQTYKNLELILVDDGSPDRCGEICERFAQTNSYTKVIHQKNQGLSAARNSGLDCAAGEYLMFVDSDDFITEDCVAYLLGLIQKYDADIAIARIRYMNEGKPLPKSEGKNRDVCLSPEETIIRMCYGKGFGCFAPGKLYKKQLFHDYRFPVGKLYEDLATTYKVIGDARRISYGDKIVYYWIQRSGSIMHSQFNHRHFDGMEAAEGLNTYVAERYPGALPAARFRYTAKAIELAAVCFTSGGDRKVFRELKQYVNRYGQEVMQDKNARKTMKLRIIGMKLGYWPARAIFAVHESVKKVMR